jgi:O-6-methylguanine DNA methyltransferase
MILLAAGDRGICMLEIGMEADFSVESDTGKITKSLDPQASALIEMQTSWLCTARDALMEYFEAGTPLPLSIPIDLSHGAPFRQAVWEALRTIPYGETRTYGEVAKMVGNPRAARAVGQACGENPLPIFVPCHRVIGHNGKLVGFTGGIHIKKALLDLERRRPPV